MNEFKYQITQIVFLVLLGLGAYWAFTHLDNGVSYTRDEIVTVNETTPQTPDETIAVIDNEVILTNDTQTGEDADAPTEETPSSDTNNEPEDSSAGEYAELIEELERIVAAEVIMSSGSNGTRVGSVQKFLDVYFDDRDITIDNDYGPTTERLVREFQNTEIGGGDGRVGPNTLGEMIDWLENN